MTAAHPSQKHFEDFLRGALKSGRHEGYPQIIRHLLNDCATCREQLSALGWSKERLGRLIQVGLNSEAAPEMSAKPAYDYSTAFARADAAISAFLTPEPATEGDTAAALLEDLEALPAGDRSERVKSRRFAQPALVRLLVERSHAARYRDPDEMLQWAALGRIAAEECSPEATGGEMKLADLRTRAWGQYGNALRVGGRQHEAERALTRSREYRDAGTGDLLLHAWLSEKLSPLQVFQGNFHAAVESCDVAARIYQDLDEDHLRAGTLVQKAIAILYSGEAEQAIGILNQAIPLIDHEADPHLFFAACHNLICCYVDLDRPDQALMLYNEAREIYQEFDDPLLLLRASWQEGRLLRDLGHLRAAETTMLRVRKGFLERKLTYEVARVSLDLASVYVKLGLVEEVKRTVLSTVPIFHALRVKLETLAALLQLQQVADQEQQAMALIRTLNSGIEALSRKSAH